MLSADKICNEVWAEINKLRTNPASFVPDLQEKAEHFNGTMYEPPNGDTMLMTQEGASAVEEAIQVLQSAKPVGALKRNKNLDRAS